MKMTFEDHDRTTVLAIEGTLTSDEVDAFRRLVTDRLGAGMTEMVLDLGALECIDSLGLGSLLWLAEEMAGLGGQLRIVQPPEVVSKILQITRLEQRFNMHESVESAARSLL